jgi:hypothetical protein
MLERLGPQPLGPDPRREPTALAGRPGHAQAGLAPEPTGPLAIDLPTLIERTRPVDRPHLTSLQSLARLQRGCCSTNRGEAAVAGSCGRGELGLVMRGRRPSHCKGERLRLRQSSDCRGFGRGSRRHSGRSTSLDDIASTSPCAQTLVRFEAHGLNAALVRLRDRRSPACADREPQTIGASPPASYPSAHQERRAK